MNTVHRFRAMILPAVALLATLGGGKSAMADLAYVSAQGDSNSSNGARFGTLDLSTGAFNVISSYEGGPGYYRGLQFVNGQLYGEGSDSHLYQINTTTGAYTDLGLITGANGNITNNVASSQQGLSYFQSTGGGFYSILPPSTTATSSVVQLSGKGATVASNGLIYESNYNSGGGGLPSGDQLDTVSPLTGAVSYVASLSNQYATFFFDGSTLYGLQYGLYTIDTTTGVENQISNSNDIITAAAVQPTAVPEPPSIVLCGLSMTALGLSRVRRRLVRR